MYKNNITQSKIKCKEIAFGNLVFNNLDIIEIYENGILSNILIPNYMNDQNLTPNEWKFVTVKYVDGIKHGNINAYMADISFAEITDKHTIKLQIEPSGFHPTIGNGLFSS